MADWSSLKPLKNHTYFLIVVILILTAILFLTPKHAFNAYGQTERAESDDSHPSVSRNETDGDDYQNKSMSVDDDVNTDSSSYSASDTILDQQTTDSSGEEKVGENDVVYDFVAIDTQPTYPGGERAFQSFFAANFKWPELALKQGANGQVVVQFVVEKDGTLTDIKIVKDMGMGIKDEVLRVLKLMPAWSPGMANGNNIRVAFTLPIRLAIDDQY